jgi:hypothetical protein
LESQAASEFVDAFPDLFKEGIGKLRGRQATLHINTDVPPKQQRHRRIPFNIRRDLEAELDRLVKLDIIAKAEGQTPWVKPYCHGS